MCVHTFPTGDESSHNFRSSRYSPSFISKIIFIKAPPWDPSISAAVFHLRMELRWWAGVRYQSYHVRAANCLWWKFKTSLKICYVIRAWRKLIGQGQLCQLRDLLGQAQWPMNTALRFQQLNLFPKHFMCLLTVVSTRSHPWSASLKG